MSSDRSSHLPTWLRYVFAHAYYWRGTVHRHFGNISGERLEYEWAVNDFSRAIDLRPGFVSAHYNRGVLYWRELENFYRAIRDMTRVIELAPGRSEAWFNRAIAYHLRGDSSQAISDLEHYLAVTQDSTWRANAESQLTMIKALATEKQKRRGQQ